MKKSWLYMLSVVLSFLFGISYFYIFAYPKNGLQPASSDIVDSAKYTLYYNQLGIYKNAQAMSEKILELKANNVEVYSYKLNDLTYFVADLSFNKDDVSKAALTLEIYGYPSILKSTEVGSDMKTLIEQGRIEDGLKLLTK